EVLPAKGLAHRGGSPSQPALAVAPRRARDTSQCPPWSDKRFAVGKRFVAIRKRREQRSVTRRPASMSPPGPPRAAGPDGRTPQAANRSVVQAHSASPATSALPAPPADEILVVDDDEVVRSVVGKLFESVGFHVTAVQSSVDALSCLA